MTLTVVGIGPGGVADRTRRAVKAIESSEVIVGYRRYVSLIEDLVGDREVMTTGMTREVERVRAALENAASGRNVVLVCSGDAGIYGMAGLVYEMIAAEPEFSDVEVKVVAGVTAGSAAAAVLGAPLMLDYASISLSDLLVPWEMIEKRLEAIASADMVTVLYNPKSKRRDWQLNRAIEIFLRHRSASTPVGLCTALGTPDESVLLVDLDSVASQTITMRSIVVVGNSTTRVIGDRMVTPRGYQL